jgi:hypothetical protein
MDHIPLLDQCFRQRFETKLYVGESYDWKGFWEFPERHGWDSEYIDLGLNRGHAQILLTRPHAHRRPGDSVQDPKAFASLLQSWLYHAMLHEVLGFQFDLDDLYYQAGSGDKILTTKHLEPLIQRWRDTMQTLPSAEARKHIANAMKCTSSVNRLMTSLSDRIKKCTADFFASKSAGKLLPLNADTQTVNMFYWQRQGRKVLPESLELSIGVLGYTLEYAARAIYLKLGLGDTDSIDCPPMPGWYIPAAIEKIMVEKGHCLLSINRFSSCLQLIGACLACTVDHASQKNDHKECNEKQCSADNIKPEDYIRKHSDDGCCCSEILDAHAWSAMLRIIDSGGIPVVRVSQVNFENPPKLAFQISDSRNVKGYVAFSHVWADGRGNPNGNGLLQCQWLELQNLAQSCLTIGSQADGDPFNDLVPFWFDVFCVPLKKESEEVKAIRLKAILMMPEIYRSATNVLVLDSGLKLLNPRSPMELGINLTFSKWMRRLWTMHEGAVGKTVKLQTSTGAIDLRSQVEQNMSLIDRDSSPSSKEVLGGIGAIESTQLWARCLHMGNMKGEEALLFAWNEAQRRSTSLASDRYIVLGIILNLDKNTLKAIQRSPKDREDVAEASKAKLRAILKAQQEFPSSIVFCEGVRSSVQGFGWAPVSIEFPIKYDRMPAGILNNHGLQVSYQGWRLHSHPNWDRKFVADHYFTNEVKDDKKPGRCAFVVQVSGDRREMYNVNVATPNWDPQSSSLRPDAHLAVVLQPQVRAKESCHRAILVEECRGLESADVNLSVIYARVHVGLQWVELTDPDNDLLNMGIANNSFEVIKASWIADRAFQRWCVGV